MAIAKQIVQMFGGNIWVNSEIDRGSEFHFIAYFNLPHMNAARNGSNTGHSDLNTTNCLSLLLVEDNVVNQKVAMRMLERAGHAVTIANNGKEALELVARKKFDLVLMDCQMPEMDGMTATREIRMKEQDQGSHLPIIAMTAHALEGDREKCIAAGMDDYVSKPIQMKLLLTLIEHWTQHPETSHTATSVVPTAET